MLRLLLGLLGVTGLLVAMPLLIGGGTALMVDSTWTDEEGFIASTSIDVEVDGYALVAGPAEIDISPDMPLEIGQLATIRLDAVNQSPSRGAVHRDCLLRRRGRLPRRGSVRDRRGYGSGLDEPLVSGGG